MLNETYRGMLAHKSVIRETFMYGKQRAAEIGYENVFDYSLGNDAGMIGAARFFMQHS